MASLRESLEAAINEQGEDDEGISRTNNTGGEAEGAEVSSIGIETDDKKVLAKETEAKLPGADKDKAVHDDSVKAPDHWKTEDKETFGRLDKAGQEFVLRRHKEMEADYTKHKQEASELQKQYEPLRNLQPVEQVVAPFRQWAQSQGINEIQMIAGWADAQRQLLTGNGKQLLLGIAQQYGIDLTGEPQDDPRYSQLNQTVSHLQNQLQQTTQLFTQNQQATVQQQIDAFANQKDSNGNLLHPHFETVLDDITFLAKAIREKGKTPNLQELYEQAVWINPTTREQVLASQREAEAEKLRKESELKKKEDQERAKKANLASANVSGDGSAQAPTRSSDIRSLLQEQIYEGRV